MNFKKLNLIVFDERENFLKSKDSLGFEGITVKRIFCVDNVNKFKSILKDELEDDDLFFLVVHIFGTTDGLIGIQKFKASGIIDEYPNLDYMYISDGNKQLDMKKRMLENKLEVKEVYKYHEVRDELKSGTFKVFSKSEFMKPKDHQVLSRKNSDNDECSHCDYAIITALEKDEMEQVLPFIERERRVPNDKHLIELGHLKKNPSKKIVYVSQQSTGMVDASILASEIILRFKPRIVIMPGVMGGRPGKTKIGDIIVSNKIFTIDKGKLTQDELEKEIESVNIKSSHTTNIERHEKDIIDYLIQQDRTRKNSIRLHFEPIACVRQVIDKEGYFEEKISSVERKSMGLEMESYGIARACELVNEGRTIPLIIKSVMDNTKNKSDDNKTYAAWVSAQCVQFILEKDII
jgi:nucleoside phosphorylase